MQDSVADWSPLHDVDEGEKLTTFEKGSSSVISSTLTLQDCERYDDPAVDACIAEAENGDCSSSSLSSRGNHLQDCKSTEPFGALENSEENCSSDPNWGSSRTEFNSVIWSGLQVSLSSPGVRDLAIHHSYVCDETFNTDMSDEWSLASSEHLHLDDSEPSDPVNSNENLSEPDRDQSDHSVPPLPLAIRRKRPSPKYSEEGILFEELFNFLSTGFWHRLLLELTNGFQMSGEAGVSAPQLQNDYASCKRCTRSEFRKCNPPSQNVGQEVKNTTTPARPILPAKPKEDGENPRLKPKREVKRPRYFEEDSTSSSCASSAISSPTAEIEALEVLTDGDWWEAHNIAERADGCICVRYVGGNPSEDEWIPRNSARIRQPQDPARIARERR